MRGETLRVVAPLCVALLAHAFAPIPRPPAVAPGARRAPVVRSSDGERSLFDRSDNGTRDDEFDLQPRSELARSGGPARDDGNETNRYYKIVASLAPSDIIGRFAATAPPRVQDAVKQTIMGLLGNAGGFALETATITTSEKLANLMFQLQMTGYMFKNAEYRAGQQKGDSTYRVSLSQSLADVPALPPGDLEEDAPDASAPPPVQGTVTVKLGVEEVRVDADAYMAELRDEVATLRRELDEVEEERRLASQKDLLAYIRALPEQQMASMTSEITDDVLDGMKKLVYSIMKGMGTSNVEANTLLQQSGSAMAQLCMWQLVIGYNLRELEVRDQLQKQLGVDDDGDGDA
ncbi:DUF760-containing protein [Aureococcus anophagefferens]|nr:DUF760-containing protein [Aureococcus anophagefferens]